MNIKRLAMALGALCVTALLLFLWGTGVLGGKKEIPQNIREQISENDGIYAELNIVPAAGILVGDILRISLDTFFNSEIISVDEGLMAEKYINLKEDSFSGCEEYSPPEFSNEKFGKIARNSISAEFQCWFTEALEKNIEANVQYIDKKNSITQTLKLNKKISFAAGPIREPRPFAEYAESDRNWGLWAAALGAILALCGAILALAIIRAERSKNRTAQKLEEEPDYFSSKISALRENIGKISAYDILDKLYHLCLELEEERGKISRLETLKKDLRVIYDPRTQIKDDIEVYFEEMERILRNGEGAEC